MIRAKRDVIIVGAGPAGCICAAYLAKAGIDVLLLEKDGIPKEKACGDMQQTGIVEHLEKLEAVEALDDMSTCIRNIKLISNNGNEALIPFECYCTPRYDLSRLLADTAVKWGAELRQGWQVTDVMETNGFVSGVKGRFQGEDAEIGSKLVIGADGAYSTIAKATGIVREDPYSIWIGERAYFKGVKLDKVLAKDQYDTYGIFAFNEVLGPGYFWIVPVGKDGVKKGICNVGMMVHNRDAYEDWELQDKFQKWIGSSKKISGMLQTAERISPWEGSKMSDVTQGVRKTGDGFMVIGDVSSTVMPMSNDGLTSAADSARAATDAAIAAIKSGDFSEEMLSEEYRQSLKAKSEKTLRNMVKETRLMIESMNDPAVMDQLVKDIADGNITYDMPHA